jgi:hypothetical protein
MKARHGITPIPLPAIQTSPTGIGRLSRETRKALAALRDRKIIVSGASGRGGVSYAHPFKIAVNEDLELTVGYGAVTSMRLDNLQPTLIACRVFFNATTPTYLANDPKFPDATIGSTTIANNTSYGVWVKVGRFPTESKAGFGGSDYDGMSSEPLIDDCEILVSSDYTAFNDPPPYDDDFAHHHIGDVQVDGDGVVSIQQRHRSDINVGIVAYPYGINFPDPP